jgi:orotate phosphoribosyltransferase
VVVAVGAILDRSGEAGGEGAGGPFDVPFVALARLDLPAWAGADCPLCREGGVPVKPGSRDRPAG